MMLPIALAATLTTGLFKSNTAPEAVEEQSLNMQQHNSFQTDSVKTLSNSLESVRALSHEGFSGIFVEDHIERVPTLDEIAVARAIWGAAKGASVEHQMAFAWCILNRVDNESLHFPNSILGVIEQPNQFTWYNENNPWEDTIEIAQAVMDCWTLEKANPDMEVGRNLPKDYLYFSTSGGVYYFTSTFLGKDYWEFDETTIVQEAPSVVVATLSSTIDDSNMAKARAIVEDTNITSNGIEAVEKTLNKENSTVSTLANSQSDAPQGIVDGYSTVVSSLSSFTVVEDSSNKAPQPNPVDTSVSTISSTQSSPTNSGNSNSTVAQVSSEDSNNSVTQVSSQNSNNSTTQVSPETPSTQGDSENILNDEVVAVSISTPINHDSPESNTESAETSQPTVVSEPIVETSTQNRVPTAEEIAIARTIFGEAGNCSKEQQAAVVWCILNRVDSSLFPNTIIGVVTQANQFHGYRASFPYDQHIEMAQDVLDRWNQEKSNPGSDVGRVLPSEYYYFTGDGKVNRYTTTWGGTNLWNFSLPSPY